MAGTSIVETTAAAAAKDDDDVKAAEPVKKEVAAVGTAMVTEESWIDYVILYKPDQARLLAPSLEERRRKAAGEPTTTDAMVTKETVPDSFIDILTKRRPLTKHLRMTDLCSSFLFKRAPKLHGLYQADMVRRNCCVDLHEDVLRQHAEKGFAEVGVDFTGGVKKIFVLPNQPQPQVIDDGLDDDMMQQHGNEGRGRRKLFVSGFAIVFALLVVLLSCVC